LDTYRHRKLDITVPAESGNAFAVAIQLEEEAGGDITAGGDSFSFIAELFDDNFSRLLAADYTITVTGGTADSADAQGGVRLTLAADGSATLTVADVSTTSTDTIWIKLTPDGHMGPVQTASMTFA